MPNSELFNGVDALITSPATSSGILRMVRGLRFPIFLHIFGVVIVIGGVLTPFVGVQFAHTILTLWSSRGPGLVRLFALVSLVLGLLTSDQKVGGSNPSRHAPMKNGSFR